MPDQFDVFISYSWTDRAFVEPLARALQDRGLRVFLDRWYLTPGRPWVEELEDVMARCKAAAICVGRRGLGRWQQREKELALARQAQDSQFPVIPVLLPGADAALAFLGLNTWVDFAAGGDDAFALDMLEGAIRGKAPGPDLLDRVRETLDGVCPYRGLRAFREEDAPFFFGREAFSQRLVEAVDRRPFVAVVGASGSGKSSVARAGLLPSLRKGANDTVWEVATMFPGNRPLHALAATLVPLLEPELSETDRLAEVGKLASHLANGDVTLRDVAARVLEAQPGTNRLLLLVDQWEELYTLTSDAEARRAFIDHVLEGVKEGPLSVVLTLRGDFFGHALSHRELADHLQDGLISLGPMTREELDRAVRSPAEKVGLKFADGLVERILDDVGDEPGNLPLLEYVLSALWERRQKGVLEHAAYEEIGGLQGAMAQRAEAVVEKLSPTDRDLVRQTMLRLVRPGAESADTRTRYPAAELPAGAPNVIENFVNARLVVSSLDPEQHVETLEVAHEALIRSWKRLRLWLDGDREFLLWRERLQTLVAAWIESNHDVSRLLRGSALSEAGQRSSNRRSDLSETERDFIDRSVAADGKRKFWKRVAVAAAALFLAAFGFVMFQMWKNEQDLEMAKLKEALLEGNLESTKEQLATETTEGLAIELANRSQRATEGGDAELAALLALESLRLREGIEGQIACMQALAELPLAPIPLATPKGMGSVLHADFSADGSRIAVADKRRRIHVWDVDSQEVVPTSPIELDSGIRALRLSPDGRRLAIRADQELILWDLVSKAKHPLGPNESQFDHALAFSSDGRTLAATTTDETVVIIDAVSGKERRRIDIPRGAAMSVALQPNGKGLYVGSSGGVLFYDLTDPSDAPRATAKGILAARLAHRPEGLAILERYGGALVLNTPSLVERSWDWSSGSSRDPDSLLSFTTDAEFVAFGDETTLEIVEAVVGNTAIERRYRSPLRGVHLAPVSGAVLTHTDQLAVEEPWRGSPTRIFEDEILDHEFSPQGTHLAAAVFPDGIAVFDTTTWQERARIPCDWGTNRRRLRFDVSFSKSGNWMIPHGAVSPTVIDTRTWQRVPLKDRDPTWTHAFLNPDEDVVVAHGPRSVAAYRTDGAEIGRAQLKEIAPKGNTDLTIDESRRWLILHRENAFVMLDRQDGFRVVANATFDEAVDDVSLSVEPLWLRLESSAGRGFVFLDVARNRATKIDARLLGEISVSEDGAYLRNVKERATRAESTEWTEIYDLPAGRKIAGLTVRTPYHPRPGGTELESERETEGDWEKLSAKRIRWRELHFKECEPTWRSWRSLAPVSRGRPWNVTSRGQLLHGNRSVVRLSPDDTRVQSSKYDAKRRWVAVKLRPARRGSGHLIAGRLRVWPLAIGEARAETSFRLGRSLTEKEWTTYLPDEDRTASPLWKRDRLVARGRFLAELGFESQARRALEQAVSRGDPTTQSDGWDSKSELDRSMAQHLLQRGRRLVKHLRPDEGRRLLGQAKARDPQLVIDVDYEVRRLTPSARELNRRLRRFAWAGLLRSAKDTIASITSLHGEDKVEERGLYAVARQGVIENQPARVLHVCERLVKLDPENGSYKETRGIARALASDTKGAIEDLTQAASSHGPGTAGDRCRKWVAALQNGENPFDRRELDSLRPQPQ